MSVTLTDGQHFVDHVKDVVTEDGEDWAVFKDHARISVDDIRDCASAEPPAGDRASYDGKLG